MFRSGQQDRTRQSASDELHQKRSRLSTSGENEPENRLILTVAQTDIMSCVSCIDLDMIYSPESVQSLLLQKIGARHIFHHHPRKLDQPLSRQFGSRPQRAMLARTSPLLSRQGMATALIPGR